MEKKAIRWLLLNSIVLSIYHLRKFLHFNIQKTCFGQRRSKDSQILYLSKPTRLLNCTLFQIFTQCVYRLGLTCCICKVLQKEKQTERPIPVFCLKMQIAIRCCLLGILFILQKFTFFLNTPKHGSFLLLWTVIFVTDIT